MRQAGFDVIEYSARFGNSTTPEEVQAAVEGYIGWIENIPIFDQAVEQGWVDRTTLEGIVDRMRRWAEHPDAFMATARCEAVGLKG